MSVSDVGDQVQSLCDSAAAANMPQPFDEGLLSTALNLVKASTDEQAQSDQAGDAAIPLAKQLREQEASTGQVPNCSDLPGSGVMLTGDPAKFTIEHLNDKNEPQDAVHCLSSTREDAVVLLQVGP